MSRVSFFWLRLLSYSDKFNSDSELFKLWETNVVTSKSHSLFILLASFWVFILKFDTRLRLTNKQRTPTPTKNAILQLQSDSGFCPSLVRIVLSWRYCLLILCGCFSSKLVRNSGNTQYSAELYSYTRLLWERLSLRFEWMHPKNFLLVCCAGTSTLICNRFVDQWGEIWRVRSNLAIKCCGGGER